MVPPKEEGIKLVGPDRNSDLKDLANSPILKRKQEETGFLSNVGYFLGAVTDKTKSNLENLIDKGKDLGGNMIETSNKFVTQSSGVIVVNFNTNFLRIMHKKNTKKL